VGEVAISGDGRWVAFSSSFSGPSDLVADPTNGTDVYLHDRQTGATTLVSHGPPGVAPNGWSGAPSISADGRSIAFHSTASNLVPADTNGATDVFVLDRDTGTITRVSVSSSGAQGVGGSYGPSISTDGRFVAFTSDAGNLADNDTRGELDVLVHDRATASTENVTFAGGAPEPYYGGGRWPRISGDGRVVAFVDVAWGARLWSRDRVTGTMQRVSVDYRGRAGDFGAQPPCAISADGRFVAFISRLQLTLDDVGFYDDDVYVRDLVAGTTTLGSYSGRSHPWYVMGSDCSLSADGRYLAFDSGWSGLVNGDANGRTDVFVRDLQRGVTTIASLDSVGAQGNNYSGRASMSGDGHLVAFVSYASNLMPNDTNGTPDAFVRDLTPGPTDEVPNEVGASFGAQPTVGVEIAEPVNTFTGNLSLSQVDLAIPGRGPALRLARSYNARDPRVGAFGPGWSSDLGWRVRERPTGEAVVFRPDGRRDVFAKNADGTYARPGGVFDELTRRPEGGFSLRTADQTTVLFASDGLLSSIADRNGTELTYTLDLDARIVRIDAVGGRSLSLEYAADGHLARADDSLAEA